ncbi:MAG: hypothetical protein A3K19_04445 [Lentisphaerae bacterium RIFOXYB12_FULL_65_16]|nr:MAG: hypothetical protein A3K18_34915 [Lentisphaerae bacterium RIFOXYA12_64_32]OGV84570.1 MAG: hypothetical protein A3K19_04445 [Lentisphaerae bacterium RIFOXYB12_FULL_65_16]
MNTASAGFFVKDITPANPVFLAGYPGRRTPSDGVNDPLFLRIAALADGNGNRVAIVTADLLKFPRDMAWRTKRWAEQALGLPSAALIINLSHTHSAPGLFHQECYPHWALDVAYVRDLEAAIRDGLAQAFADLRPVSVRYGLHQAHFGVSRRRPDPARPGKVGLGLNPDGYYDPDLPVLAFRDATDGRLRAVLYSYACHPTSKHENLVSADYPGEVSRGLKRMLGDDVVTLFAQGGGGSVMPRYNYGTPEDKAVYAQRWRSVADDLAVFVGSDAMREIPLELAASEREFGIPYDMSQALSEAQLLAYADPHEPPLDGFFRPANREILRLWAAGLLERQRTGTQSDAFRMHVTRWQLCKDLQLIGLSGEVTADVGRMIKAVEAPRPTIFLGYCSYTDAYIPTAAMIPEEGHEGKYSIYFHMRPAPFVPAIDDIIRREAAKTA